MQKLRAQAQEQLYKGQILASLFSCHVTLGKSFILNFFFLYIVMGTAVTPTSKDYYKEYVT